MAESKSAKRPAKGTMSDVKSADAVPTASTSRPVLITNRPMVADPMLSKKAQTATEVSVPTTPDNLPPAARPIASPSRSGKTIAPLTQDSSVPEKTAIGTETQEIVPSATEEVAQPETETAPDKKTTEPEPTPATEEVVEEATEDDEDDEPDIDPSAVQEKTAEQLRQERLDEMVAKGTYAVPIDRVEARRNKFILLLVATILLAIIIFDVVLDMGLTHIVNLPHTNFFHGA